MARAENLINIHILCVRKRSYTYAHGGAAHAAVENNGGLQTDANCRYSTSDNARGGATVELYDAAYRDAD